MPTSVRIRGLFPAPKEGCRNGATLRYRAKRVAPQPAGPGLETAGAAGWALTVR